MINNVGICSAWMLLLGAAHLISCVSFVLLACRSALAQGYRQIDCASFYGNETTIGEGLQDFIKEEGREQLFVTSKVWNDAHRPHLVRCSIL